MKVVLCRICQEFQTYRMGGIDNELLILDHHFDETMNHVCLGSGNYATTQPFDIPLLPCPVCQKEFYNLHREYGLLCMECNLIEEEARMPKMNLLDKIIVRLLGKYARFRDRVTPGFDPYGGYQLDLFPNKNFTTRYLITISNVISWSVQIGLYWFNEDDRLVMWIAQRLHEAFLTQHEVNEYNMPEEHSLSYYE